MSSTSSCGGILRIIRMRSAPWESKTPTDVQSAVASPVTIASGRFDLFAKPSANDRCFSKRTTAVGRRSLQEAQDATGGRADADLQGTRLVLPFRKISVTDSRSDWQVVGIRGEGWSPTPADPHRAGVAHAARLGSSRCQEGASGCARWASRAPSPLRLEPIVWRPRIRVYRLPGAYLAI
jgi:hypothetical protein